MNIGQHSRRDKEQNIYSGNEQTNTILVARLRLTVKLTVYEGTHKHSRIHTDSDAVTKYNDDRDG